MIDIEQAYAALAEAAAVFPEPGGGDPVPTDRALGRYLAEDVACRMDNPPFAQSAMDGIAFRAEDAGEALQCIGTVAAGAVPDAVTPGPGACVRIMTGAPVPSSADTVEMVEKVVFEGETARLTEPVTRAQHIRPRGENMRAGEVLYAAGTRVTPAVMAGLLSQGIRYLSVKRKLRIGVAATGDEVTDYRMPLRPGCIYNSNGPATAAMLDPAVFEVSYLGTLPDDLAVTQALLAQNTELDVILLSGGVSMGDFDMVPEAAARAGFSRVFHKIRMKPGKPVWFGRHPRGTLLFGMPGNPVSVWVGTMLYVLPTLAGILSGRFAQPDWGMVRAGEDFSNQGTLTLFVGVQLQTSSEGTVAVPCRTSGSGDIIRFSGAKTLCRLPPGAALKRGDTIEVLLPFSAGIS